jgi:hypothetical protein
MIKMIEVLAVVAVVAVEKSQTMEKKTNDGLERKINQNGKLESIIPD